MRLFIAIDLPQSIREQLYRISSDLKLKIDDLRPTPPQNIHLTLKFLGNTDVSLIENIKNALDETAKDFKKIDMTLGEIGVFPGYSFPRVVWIAPDKGTDEIKQLKEKLDIQLYSLSIAKDEKSFKAHTTIARFKSRKKKTNLKEILSAAKPGITSNILIEGLHLYQSTLTPKGPVYTKLHTAAFHS